MRPVLVELIVSGAGDIEISSEVVSAIIEVVKQAVGIQRKRGPSQPEGQGRYRGQCWWPTCRYASLFSTAKAACRKYFLMVATYS